MGAIGNRLEPHPSNPLRKEISASCAPSAVERQALTERHTELVASLTPGGSDDEDIEDHILLLFTACNAFSMSEQESTARANVYRRLLSEHPGWAIKLACMRMATGKFTSDWNGKSVPTTNEIINEIKIILLPWRSEEHRVRQILTAEVWGKQTTPEQREANVIEFAKVLADYRRSVAPDLTRNLPSEQEREHAVEQLHTLKGSLSVGDAGGPGAQDDLQRSVSRGSGGDASQDGGHPGRTEQGGAG